MSFAERLSSFCEEALTLEILVAFRALEALTVVVIVESLYPAVSSLDREPAPYALRRKQVVPISFTVR